MLSLIKKLMSRSAAQLIAPVLVCSCASSYRFVSQPTEATVYFLNGAEKVLIGQTPIDYTKSALPTDAPFTIQYEKPGFETREISVAPTDNSLTTVNATLKPSKDAAADPSLKKTRSILQKVFAIQELTARQKYVEALSGLNKLEDAEPGLAEVHIMKGSIYFLLNDREQAKKQWEAALKLDPTLDELRVKLKALSPAVKGAGQ